MQPAVPKPKAPEYLFRCHLPVRHLKTLVAAAQVIGDEVTLRFNSADETAPIRFWAVDEAKPRIALVGQINGSSFFGVDGNGEDHTVDIPARKQFLPMVNAFDMKDIKAQGHARLIELRLTTEEGKYVLRLVQSKNDDAQPDVRTVTVSPSDGQPQAPVLGKKAYATVALGSLKKVLDGLKKNTDVVTVAVHPDEFEVTASSKRVQDGWRHPCAASGKAAALFSAALLKKAVQGAAAASDFGEVHLGTDTDPLLLVAAEEHLTANFYVASRGVMK